LEDHGTMPDLIVIDGYVYLDGAEKAGLGKHLFDALDRKVGIIGVAKNPFKYISADFAVYRGRSKKPLYVTAAGVPVALAKRRVATMRGAFRVPTLLKEADRVSRGFECRGARVSAAVMLS
jgi:deoxyribonuclease V